MNVMDKHKICPLIEEGKEGEREERREGGEGGREEGRS